EVVYHRGWGSHLILAEVRWTRSQSLGQAYGPVTAEVRARPPARSVERDEARVHECHEDPAPAGGRRSAVRIHPGGHAAIRPVTVVAGEIEQRIEIPSFFAGDGIERDDPAE